MFILFYQIIEKDLDTLIKQSVHNNYLDQYTVIEQPVHYMHGVGSSLQSFRCGITRCTRSWSTAIMPHSFSVTCHVSQRIYSFLLFVLPYRTLNQDWLFYWSMLCVCDCSIRVSQSSFLLCHYFSGLFIMKAKLIISTCYYLRRGQMICLSGCTDHERNITIVYKQ